MIIPPMHPQYELLRPLVTERIKTLVRGRLLEGLKFFRDGVMSRDYSRADVKLCLLLVQIANPKEFFTADELAILEGRQRLLAGQSRLSRQHQHKQRHEKKDGKPEALSQQNKDGKNLGCKDKSAQNEEAFVR